MNRISKQLIRIANDQKIVSALQEFKEKLSKLHEGNLFDKFVAKSFLDYNKAMKDSGLQNELVDLIVFLDKKGIGSKEQYYTILGKPYFDISRRIYDSVSTETRKKMENVQFDKLCEWVNKQKTQKKGLKSIMTALYKQSNKLCKKVDQLIKKAQNGELQSKGQNKQEQLDFQVDQI